MHGKPWNYICRFLRANFGSFRSYDLSAPTVARLVPGARQLWVVCARPVDYDQIRLREFADSISRTQTGLMRQDVAGEDVR